MNKSKKFKIIYLTQIFTPEPIPKGIEFVNKLKDKGYEVEVITALPNYPFGKVYKGYNPFKIRVERIKDIKIVRLPIFASHDKNFLKRALTYISFSLGAFIYGIIFIKEADLIIAYHPPLTTGLIACMLRKIKKIPIIYEIQDVWPDTFKATRIIKSEIIMKLINILCDYVYKNVDHLTVISKGFKKLLVSRGVNPQKISIIYNCAPEINTNHLSPEIFHKKLKNKFVISYAGNIGKAQSLDSLLKAALILKNKKNTKIMFLIIGDGVELNSLKNLSKELKLNNVMFHQSVPLNKIGAFLKYSNALFIHLRDDPLFEITIPGKTQGYLSIGKPILMAVKGEAAELILKSNSGIIANPDDPLSIADSANQLSNLKKEQLLNFEKNALLFYKTNLSLDNAVKKYIRLFSEIKFNK